MNCTLIYRYISSAHKSNNGNTLDEENVIINNKTKGIYLLFQVSKFKEDNVIFLHDLDGTIYPFHGSMTLYKQTQFVKTYIQKINIWPSVYEQNI